MKSIGFECPICSGVRYNALDRASRAYLCACCGFSFSDPGRYRPRLAPFSTLRQEPIADDARLRGSA